MQVDEDFLDFVRARQDHLLRAAVLVCGNHHLAQDLLQDALAKLASRWSQVRDGAPEAYVRTILYRDAISHWRKWRREKPYDVHSPDGDFVTLEDPENMILAQNVVPLVSADLSEELAEVLDPVSAELTTEALIQMNAASVNDQQDSATIAENWLTETGL